MSVIEAGVRPRVGWQERRKLDAYRHPKGDAKGLVSNAYDIAAGENVLWLYDFDGPVGPVKETREGVANPDGTWDDDTVVPTGFLAKLHRSLKHALGAIVTGGSATRGFTLAKTRRMFVSGAEGAEFFDPRRGAVVPKAEFESIQPTIAHIVGYVNSMLGDRLATKEHPDRDVKAEPKGDATCTWHPIDEQALQSFRNAVSTLGFTWDGREINGATEYVNSQTGEKLELLMDRQNKAMTLRPFGVSKETAAPEVVHKVEEVYGKTKLSIFVGDGSTDVHAIVGGRMLQAERRAMGDRDFRFIGLAAITERGLDRDLALAADAIVLGSSVEPGNEWGTPVTHEFVLNKLRTDEEFAELFDELGITDRRTRLSSEPEDVAATEAAIFGLATMEDMLDLSVERLPERDNLQDFERPDQLKVVSHEGSPYHQVTTATPGLN